MKVTSYLVTLILFSSLNAFAQIGESDGPGNLHPDGDQKRNYMVCNVSILNKKDKVLSTHLITTYAPSSSVMQVGSTPYHYPEAVSSNCAFQVFNKAQHKKSFHKASGNYLDICYKITNGVLETENGYAELYLVKRPVKNVVSLQYMNQDTPLKLNGTEKIERPIGDYKLKADCENKMLTPLDPIWAEIKKERLGDVDNVVELYKPATNEVGREIIPEKEVSSGKTKNSKKSSKQ